jgi:hypothetical protein
MDKQQQIDHAYDADQRGEHRYPDTHQRESERVARQKRDELKERMTESSWKRRLPQSPR